MIHREARSIRVRGVVQGVGFRPFVYRIAHEHGIEGWVRNDSLGVLVHAQAAGEALDRFEHAIAAQAPPASRITAIDSEAVQLAEHTGFTIVQSEETGPPTTRISPDLCVCEDCIADLNDPRDPRYLYPYVNCTNCGPRYSIIKSLPYDRPATTMAGWAMCQSCLDEYRDPTDRRYHAQPTACLKCGPNYRLEHEAHENAVGVDAIEHAARLLREGMIVAIKGIGGYHLACDAENADAVESMRERKFRKEKPFAVMVPSLEDAEALVRLDSVQRAELTSMARPILLAEGRRTLEGVHPGVDEIGVMLPYTPLHHMLFAASAPRMLVLTSANRSSEPIAYRDDDARERLAGIADAFLIGERPIQRRVDDSVVTTRRGAPFMIRRARGYAPASVATVEHGRPILAVGADLKNAIALAIDGEVIVSPYIGDLGDLETDRAFRETIEDFLSMYAIDRCELIIAHDLHPEYASTREALGFEAAQHVGVQHHEAHIASVMLEHGRLDEEVLGVALDGTGYGRDGTIWGAEMLIGSPARGFERTPLFPAVPMPGGDAAARHPEQAAAAFIGAIPIEQFESEPIGFSPTFRRARAMVERGLRCMTSTSAGRLFDAIAAVCGFNHPISYEGQAAIWLEQLAREGDVQVHEPEPCKSLAELPTICARMRLDGTPPSAVSRYFHDAFASIIVSTIRGAMASSSLRVVALSGGVWQNRRLLDAVIEGLHDHADVLFTSAVPVNDGGIAPGQIAIAAAQAASQ